MNRRFAMLPAVMLLTALSGCAAGPDFTAPNLSMPPAWMQAAADPVTPDSADPGSGGMSALGRDRTAAEDRAAAEVPPVVSAEPTPDLRRWWDRFSDPVLSKLVDTVLAANLDLKQAEARVRQARAVRRGVVADLFPTITAGSSYTRSERSSGSFSVPSDSVPAEGGTISSSGRRVTDLFQAGLDAAWEIDLFGGTRRSIEAASADLSAVHRDAEALALSLMSETALTYLEIRTLQERLSVARERLAAEESLAALTRTRFNAGFVNGLDVASAEALAATTRSTIPALEASLVERKGALAVLLGVLPGEIPAEVDHHAPIPNPPRLLSIGVPAELLTRRPDIRAAHDRLHAETARIGIRTAELYPTISLTGSLGVSGDTISALSNWQKRFWSFGPGVSWPLFDAGRIRSGIEAQNFAAEEALYAYKNQVLVALKEVESALAQLHQEERRRLALEDAVRANRRAVTLANDLYRQGLTDFLNLLNAERSLFITEESLVQSEQTLANAAVAVFKALGGGWEAGPPRP